MELTRLVAAVCAIACGCTSYAIAQSPARLAPAVEATLAAGEEASGLRALREWEESTFRRGAAPGPLGSGHAPLESVTVPETPAPETVDAVDLTYLRGARLPDLPMRWDDRVVTYLEHFRADARGRALMTGWLRRATRWDNVIREALRAEGLPEDLRCVALAESGFDPTVRSPVGALGMWQFVAVTGAEYGLSQSHWIDERMDPYASTRAAARYLGDLHRRLGSWELALAAYNMGYGALLRAIRKYNSNDYGVLSHIEAGLPFETTLYVSKILACSVVMRNADRFGFADVSRDPPLMTVAMDVPGGTSVDEIARAAGVEARELRTLNPHLLRGRTPPGVATYPVRLPHAAAATFTQRWAQRRPERVEHTSAFLRQGESLAEMAHAYRTTDTELRRINELDDSADVIPGTALLVPNVRPRAAARSTETVVVTVPSTTFAYPDRRRVFYRITTGDDAERLSRFFRVSVDELSTWNDIDVRARLHTGMILQLFVPRAVNLERAIVLTERDVHVLVAGTDAFFDYHETQRGRVRVRYRVQTGDTLGTIAQRFGLTIGDVSRINQIRRDARLRVGSDLIVYTSRDLAATMQSAPPPLGQVPEAVAPDTVLDDVAEPTRDDMASEREATDRERQSAVP